MKSVTSGDDYIKIQNYSQMMEPLGLLRCGGAGVGDPERAKEPTPLPTPSPAWLYLGCSCGGQP